MEPTDPKHHNERSGLERWLAMEQRLREAFTRIAALEAAVARIEAAPDVTVLLVEAS